jgi:hypothetical protein
MTRAEKTRCWIYGLLALVAFVGTQWALLDFLRLDDNGGLSGMWDDITNGPAATFVSIDLGIVALAAVVFMIAEGRSIRMPWVWVYVALVFLVAASVAFPLFLIGRTRHLAAARTA